MGKKFFVTFQLCLLTTSVYIGSAIYTAGLVGPGSVVEQFKVSPVVALLGLSLFVGTSSSPTNIESHKPSTNVRNCSRLWSRTYG